MTLLLLATAVWAGTPAELVEEILKNPGYFTQNCSGPPALPPGELPLFGYRRGWSDKKISADNFSRLRARRQEVLPEISKRLDAVDLEEWTHYYWDRPAEILLMFVVDLNGVEALPSLLRLEQRLAEKADYKPPAELRVLPAHVQVLSVISAVLKNEGAAGSLGEQRALPYDREHRDLIVRLATGFLKNVKPDRWKRADGMTPEPQVR